MTEQINDQISAFIDDELSADESAMLVRRFERDPEARGRALRYTLIGDALRGQLLEPNPSILRRRVAASLSGAQAASPAKAAAGWPLRFARPALGFGIAAAVAIVAIGVLRVVNDTQVAPVPVAATVETAQPLQVRAIGDEAPSYVVPQEAPEGRAVTPPIRLTNYLMRHGEYASGLSRTSVHSNVVSATTELPARVEKTEARQ
jgi:sigma-E factor negative regulatory protein RseA